MPVAISGQMDDIAIIGIDPRAIKLLEVTKPLLYIDSR